MTTDPSIAKIQQDFESQIRTAKAEVESLASQAKGTMTKAEEDAYATLSPKMQAIEQKLQDLRKATGIQHKQTKTDLERLIGDFKKSVKAIKAAA